MPLTVEILITGYPQVRLWYQTLRHKLRMELHRNRGHTLGNKSAFFHQFNAWTDSHFNFPLLVRADLNEIVYDYPANDFNPKWICLIDKGGKYH